ncbi:MAG: asparagine synthase (glutamine-hydrolyzing) [Chloroflexi bacterium]|nr:asparagine synthase (glutamine-hydrolyzing) [Chloroflexota bacterium]
MADEPLLRAMSAAIAHRGPDDENYYTSPNVSLAYRRLAIIDREKGNQPIFNEDGTKVIVYNGEVYNFRKLRERIEANHTFKTNSDTEVILHLYEEYGEEAIVQLNGMFAFAIYDSQADRLLLARDRFGIKPLYYLVEDGRLLFASEIKALLHYKRPEPNEEQIYQYLVYRLHDHNEETFFSGIKRLLPGTLLTYEGGEVAIKRYWEPSFESAVDLSEAELSERFERLFLDSVRSQLVGEVPIGSCLSGGLDSSSIVAAISRLIGESIPERAVVGERQKTFSAVFPGEVNDETAYIDRLTADVEVEQQLITPQRGDLWPELEKIVYHQDEPFVSTGLFAQWEVMKAASQKVTVLLDGQGADELLAGYTPYYFVYLRQLLKERRLFRFAKEFVMSLDILLFASFEQIKRRLGMAKAIDPETLLAGSFAERSRTPPPMVPCKDDLNKRLWEDITVRSLPPLLRYEDKNSMAFSIESRVPFLDNDLVDFILALPPSLKIKNGWSKYIMRRAMRDYLPGKIRNRRWKVGFTTPETSWMRAEKDRVLEIFASSSFRSRPYFDVEKVREAFEWFVEGKTNESLVFWRILNVELWLRVFFDGDPHERFGVRPAE